MDKRDIARKSPSPPALMAVDPPSVVSTPSFSWTQKYFNCFFGVVIVRPPSPFDHVFPLQNRILFVSMWARIMEIWGSEDEECIVNIMKIWGGEVACKSICIGNQPGQLNIPPVSRIRKENTQKWRQHRDVRVTSFWRGGARWRNINTSWGEGLLFWGGSRRRWTH